MAGDRSVEAVRIGIFYSRMEGIGGVENYILWTARGLAQRGHQVTVACDEANPMLVDHYQKWGFPLQAPAALAQQDVVNIHNSPGWLHYLALPERPPAVASIHEPPRDIYEEEMDYHFLHSPINRERKPWTRAWDRMMKRRARRVDQEAIRQYPVLLTDSHYIADRVRAIYGRSDAIAVPFGIDRQDVATSAPPLRPPGFFLAVSRLTIVKNLQTVLAAMQHLPECRLVVAGEGDEKSRLEKQIGAAQVEFLGRVSDEEKAVLLRDCRALVHLPLDEPFGLVGLEAGLAGKPALVSNHGGLVEIVVDGRTGLHLPPTDVATVVKAMRRLQENPEQAEAMGQAGREHVLAHYSQEQYLTRMEELLGASRQAHLMKLGIDVTWLSVDRRGMGRYVESVLVRLLGRADIRLTLMARDPAIGPAVRDRLGLPVPDLVPWHAPALHHLDVCWYPWNRVDTTPRTRRVSTIHDTAMVDWPVRGHAFAWLDNRRMRSMLQRTVERSNRIMVPSKFTGQRLQALFPHMPVDRVVQVSEGHRGLKTGETPRPVSLDAVCQAFVLHVGGLDPRKNAVGLLQAWSQIQERQTLPGRLLVMAGLDPQPQLVATGRETVVWLGHVGDRELQWLYRHCEAAVVPSFYEGFGLPLLEAMAAGAPVVSSRAASLPEVGGDVPEYFDPHTPADMARALETVLQDPERVVRMRAAGEERARDFTWERATEQVVACLEACAAPGDP